MHRNVEILIGRLVTDEEFRAAFRRDPGLALATAGAQGLALTVAEVAALLDTERTLWDRMAAEIDARLQKASLHVRRRPEIDRDTTS